MGSSGTQGDDAGGTDDDDEDEDEEEEEEEEGGEEGGEEYEQEDEDEDGQHEVTQSARPYPIQHSSTQTLPGRRRDSAAQMMGNLTLNSTSAGTPAYNMAPRPTYTNSAYTGRTGHPSSQAYVSGSSHSTYLLTTTQSPTNAGAQAAADQSGQNSVTDLPPNIQAQLRSLQRRYIQTDASTNNFELLDSRKHMASRGSV